MGQSVQETCVPLRRTKKYSQRHLTLSKVPENTIGVTTGRQIGVGIYTVYGKYSYFRNGTGRFSRGQYQQTLNIKGTGALSLVRVRLRKSWGGWPCKKKKKKKKK